MPQELKEFVDLLFREVGIVGGVFYFEGVAVLAFSRYYIWKRVEAWVAYWDTYGIVAFFLQQLH